MMALDYGAWGPSYANAGGTGWPNTNTGTGNSISYRLKYDLDDVEPEKPAPLAWLNRRVDDMVSKGKQALEAA